MKISNNTLTKIFLGSTLGFFGSCGSSLYLGRPTPEDEQMWEIQKNKYSVTEMVMGCVPREPSASLSDKCRNLVQRYDSLGKEAVALENSPAYVSSQQQKKYSNYLLGLSVLSIAAGLVASRMLRKRLEEEGQAQGEQ